MEPTKTCIIVVGPTAVGKTALAIELASHYHTGIISADSRQCFRELGIAVAKPSPEELITVPHHFVNSHSIHDEVNAAVFEKYALEAASEIFVRSDQLVMVGGTGLYIKAFLEGMDSIPEIPGDLRREIIDGYEKYGLNWLQEEVKNRDPLFYAEGEIKNPQRVMRALEVKLATGKSILSFHGKQTMQRDFKVIKIGLELPRDQLYTRINRRVDNMVDQGLVDEARSLYPFAHINALQTVGYKELFDHFRGVHDLAKAIDLIKTNTRRYAKRQLTWFKRDEAIKWFSPSEAYQIIDHVQALS